MSKTGDNLDQSINTDGTAADFGEWDDRELKNSYHRLSKQLIHYGVDRDIIIRMALVEEHLRERGVNPEEIIEDLWDH